MSLELVAALRRRADELEALSCTGLSASWCPVHGDCTCPRDADGVPLSPELDGFDLSAPGCPLHDPVASSHAEAAD